VGIRDSPEQQAFLAAVQAGGGIAAVVRGFEDVDRVLFTDNSIYTGY